MSVARPSDGLLTASQTMALVGLIGLTSEGRAKDHILRDMSALYPATKARAHNTLMLLERFEIVTTVGINCRLAKAPVSEPEVRFQLCRAVAAAYVEKLSLDGVAGCIKKMNSLEGLWLDSMLLPASSEGLPYWLVEFGIATREKTTSRLWRVSTSYEALFLNAARNANRRVSKQLVSLEDLKLQLLLNEQHGAEAEQWVLQYEKQRLSQHPLLDQIRIVSSADTGAGFDIVSFSDASALQHDFFIEVKSFSRPKRFFWTRNEVEVAKELGENYALYLIDRSEMARPNYQPQIVRGPYSALFETKEYACDHSPSVFEFRPSDNHDPVVG